MSAPEPGRAVAPTPGQAAYEAHQRAHGVRTPRDNWKHQGSHERDCWEAAAQAVLDASESPLPAQLAMAQEAISDLAADRDDLRDHIDSLARGLDMSARTSHPSKKSEIERGCADALFGLLRVDGESIADTRKRLGVPQ